MSFDLATYPHVLQLDLVPGSIVEISIKSTYHIRVWMSRFIGIHSIDGNMIKFGYLNGGRPIVTKIDEDDTISKIETISNHIPRLISEMEQMTTFEEGTQLTLMLPVYDTVDEIIYHNISGR